MACRTGSRTCHNQTTILMRGLGFSVSAQVFGAIHGNNILIAGANLHLHQRLHNAGAKVSCSGKWSGKASRETLDVDNDPSCCGNRHRMAISDVKVGYGLCRSLQAARSQLQTMPYARKTGSYLVESDTTCSISARCNQQKNIPAMILWRMCSIGASCAMFCRGCEARIRYSRG